MLLILDFGRARQLGCSLARTCPLSTPKEDRGMWEHGPLSLPPICTTSLLICLEWGKYTLKFNLDMQNIKGRRGLCRSPVCFWLY